jgi:hypothetical protein
MSDRCEFEIIKITEKITIDKIKINKKIDKITPVVFSSKNISQKMSTWRIMQREKLNFVTESQISSDDRLSENRYRNLDYNHCKTMCSQCNKK